MPMAIVQAVGHDCEVEQVCVVGPAHQHVAGCYCKWLGDLDSNQD
mgnify:CR=1 FL=1